jgi:hypothetical protein
MSDQKIATTVTTVQTVDDQGKVISETKTTVETIKPDPPPSVGMYL